MTASQQSAWTPFRTTSIDETHAHMCAAYLELRAQRSSVQPGFAWETEFAHLGDVTVSHASYQSISSRLITEPFDDPCFIQLHSGHYRVAGPGEDYAVAPGGALLLVPRRRLDLRVGDFRLSTVTLPYALVQDVGHELIDVPAGMAVLFQSARPVSRVLEKQWLSSVAYVERSILAHPVLAGNALITGQARRLLTATALATFPNTTTHLENRSAGEASRAAVRRAVDFIDANPGRDVTATEIAAAARLAVPSLVEAFRTYLGTTPRAYLRRTRLELAHRDLRDSDPQHGSVTEVARRWGFLDVRRFAAEYRRAFGRSPMETLRS